VVYRRQWAWMQSFQITKGGKLYLERLRILQTPLFSIYIHRIHIPDLDEFPHDHPWWFASLVLSGGYTENIYFAQDNLANTRVRIRGRWSLRSMPRHRAHRITAIKETLWTLVLTGKHHQSWSFWTPAGPLDWKSLGGDGPDP
jgi:hypothetical protein